MQDCSVPKPTVGKGEARSKNCWFCDVHHLHTGALLLLDDGNQVVKILAAESSLLGARANVLGVDVSRKG